MKSILLTLVVFLLFVGQLLAQDELRYLHRKSALGENAPILFLLHGYGSNEYDLFDLVPRISDRYTVVSLRAPHVLGDKKYSWYGLQWEEGKVVGRDTKQAEESRLLLLREVERLVAHFKADPKHVYMMGFSQGAIMSMGLGVSHPEIIEGVISLSGMLEPGFAARAKDCKRLTVFLSHGRTDAVIPFTESTSAKEKLEGFGANVRYYPFSGGHTVTYSTITQAMKWLRAKSW